MSFQESILELQNISVQIADRLVLQDLSHVFSRSETTLVTGISGCGKTTLGRVLSGLIPEHYPADISGKICLDGQAINNKSLEELSAIITFVPAHSWGRFFQISVFDEIAFALFNQGMKSEEVTQRVTQTAETLGLETLLQRRTDELSSGLQQKVSIASALAMRPAWLILDEPSSCLDTKSILNLVKTLQNVKSSRHTGIIILEHRYNEFASLIDQLIILDKGSFIFSDTMESARKNHRQLFRRMGLRDPGSSELKNWTQFIVPTESKHRVEGNLILKNVSGKYHNTIAVNDINLSLRYSTITALAGANGSGKTTLGRIIAGLHQSTSGSIMLDGKPLKGINGTRVGMMVMDPRNMLFCRTIHEEIRIGAHLMKIPDAEIHAQTMIDFLDLYSIQNKNPFYVSGGQQLRTALAAILALRPKIIIMDEPARGQDWSHITGLMKFLRAFIRENESICLLITHEVKIVRHFADNIIVLDQGRIVAKGTPRQCRM